MLSPDNHTGYKNILHLHGDALFLMFFDNVFPSCLIITLITRIFDTFIQQFCMSLNMILWCWLSQKYFPHSCLDFICRLIVPWFGAWRSHCNWWHEYLTPSWKDSWWYSRWPWVVARKSHLLQEYLTPSCLYLDVS